MEHMYSRVGVEAMLLPPPLLTANSMHEPTVSS